jgi:hypothetical protein
MSTSFIPRDALWASLDELVEAWVAFSSEVLTASAARAISEAFAALAHEKEALHLVTTEEQTPPRTPVEAITWHDESIACLVQAATHWYQAASTLAAGTMEYLYDQATTTQQVYQPLITSALVQCLRVWTLAQRLIQEQVQLCPPHRQDVSACEGV